MMNSKRGRFNKHKDQRKVSVDQLSLLPDELLGLILSFMTLKEAAATSILSKRWNRYLWLLTPKLDLDGIDSLRKVKMESPSLKKEYPRRGGGHRYYDRDYGYDYDYIYDYDRDHDHDRDDRARSGENESSPLEKGRRNYVRWVDSVVAKHESTQWPRVEDFIVSFDLSSSHADWIDAWLSYALRKKVERLELNLIDVINVDTNCSNYDESLYKYPKKKTNLYSFPYDKGNLPNNFKLVKKLCLHSVNVTGEAVEFFLANCPLLEQVSVSESQMLSSLKIMETSPKFKCLEISSCHNLKSVEIRDSNVVTIKYGGKRIDFLLVNVARLTELWVRVGCLTNVVKMFASVLPQLEMLKIYFTCELSLKDSKKFVSAVEMFSLKEMVVSLENGYDDDRADSLSSLIDLMGASPCLQRFVLEAPKSHQHIKPKTKLEEDAANSVTREMLKMIPRAYFCLKEVEFVGYRGVVNQLKAILHFKDNAVALENIIVDPRCFKLCSYRPWDRISQNENIDDDDEILANANAQLIKMFVDSKINVKIL